MKKIFLGLLFLSVISTAQADDWKGKPGTDEVGFGGMLGMGVIDSSVGLAVLGTASKKVVSQGFIPDINNSVSIEGALGPVFLPGGTAIAYSAHLRWDFQKDEMWTLYGLGGVGGNYLSVSGANRFEFFPRFGVGAFLRVNEFIQCRAEVSHEWIALGIHFPL